MIVAICGLCLNILVTDVYAADNMSPPPWEAFHAWAIKLARQGHYAEAIPILQDLDRRHPDNVGVVRDYLTVLGWAGHYDSQVTTLYRTLPPGEQPDYVLEVVGLAYRNQHDPHDALPLYQQGLARAPDSLVFANGVIRCYAESGDYSSALMQADSNLQSHGNRLEILVAAGDAASQGARFNKAVDYYEAALNLDPHNKDALIGLIRVDKQMGSPQLARRLADQNPGLMAPEEYRQILGDEAALYVRWGMMTPPSEAQRYIYTDQAIGKLDALIAQWQQQGDAAQKDILRAKFDRILALHNRLKMAEVIRQYQELRQQEVEIPNYVLGCAGDAYLTDHQPEQARALYLKVLQTEPHNDSIRRQLFYSYIDSDDYNNAFLTIDGMAQDPHNPNRANDRITAGQARLFAGQVAEADAYIAPVAKIAPSKPVYHEALGNLYAAHGWPQQAQQQYQLSGNISSQVGIVGTQLRLQQFPDADATARNLIERLPENPQTQRAYRDWQIHDMAELQIKLENDFTPMTSTNVSGGRAYGVDTLIYSSPLDYNWRVFAGEFYTHQVEPNAEGSIGFSRSTAGIEYRNGDLTARTAPTYNHYDGTGRAGEATDATWRIDDNWSVAGSGELLSRDTPLRAMNAGVTADEAAARVTWRESEQRQLSVGATIMPFSDGNLRTGGGADYTERLFTIPHIAVDGVADLGESQNSADDNRRYYNPRQDFIALGGARTTQILYQHYSTVYQHSLLITPGIYMQDYYGDSAALRMRYEQRFFYNNTLNAGLGVNFSRQAYDGAPENDISLIFDLSERF